VTIIQGEEDEVVDVEAVAAFAEKQSTKPAIIRVADCSHFFHGRLNELVEAATTTFP
jgi:alpha/beta superfamily hydrolase